MLCVTITIVYSFFSCKISSSIFAVAIGARSVDAGRALPMRVIFEIEQRGVARVCYEIDGAAIAAVTAIPTTAGTAVLVADATAVGTNSTAGDFATAVGFSSSATGIASTAVGIVADAAGDYATASKPLRWMIDSNRSAGPPGRFLPRSQSETRFFETLR